MFHDAFVDTVPSGYYKKSRNPDRPGFRKNAITLNAWVTGLAVNALKSFTTLLPKRFLLAHPRTLRRWFLNMVADLYLGKGTLIVIMRPRSFRGWWKKKIDRLSTKNIRCLGWKTDSSSTHSVIPPPRTGTVKRSTGSAAKRLVLGAGRWTFLSSPS